ncbi:hypothetical protein J5N97_001749 [Dioscorea zingiberensis]|uniref:Response regulatory domain-containing protein n=1 Tax=Dioscorea zingiberensis TaxID=325984 RepID=A0A9D5H241_9LILI|nr:hypothetical protein J5N97_001749 [Dioscorea zingiberensis]
MTCSRKSRNQHLSRTSHVVIMSSENAPSRTNRCLEGADEFFLKPVRLSDMKKLRPHILKGKSNEQQEDEQQQQQINLLSLILSLKLYR